jgi:hypothetical protein
MKHPDWYPDWRHDAVHQLQDKNARLKAEIRLGDWPRYDYDVDTGTLIFSDQGASKVIAEIQIVGTTSVKAGNWLWAWANSDCPSERVTDAELVRAFGEEHGICDPRTAAHFDARGRSKLLIPFMPRRSGLESLQANNS